MINITGQIVILPFSVKEVMVFQPNRIHMGLMQMSLFSQVLFSRSEAVKISSLFLVEKSPLYLVLKCKSQKEKGNKATPLLGQQQHTTTYLLNKKH